MSKNPLIFIVEDDTAYSSLIKKYLFMNGVRNMEIYNSGESCLENINKNPQIIIQDYDLPGINGFEVLKKVKEINENCDFIFLSGQQSIEVAVDIMKHGAIDYVIKDDSAKELILKKTKRLIHFRKLEAKHKLNRLGMIIFGIALVATWIFISFLIFIGKFEV